MENYHIERALGRVEGKVDGLENDIKEIKMMLQARDGIDATTSKRISSLEHSRSKLLGTVSGVASIFGVLGSWLATNLLPRIPH